MVFKFLSAAVVAAVFGATSAEAQSVGQIGGPANMPPATFKGQQWVDSRGCVFLKAGYGGQINWVPRVGRDRKALCGYPPTGSTRSAIEVATADEMAAPVAPVVEAKPAATKLAAVAPVIPVAPLVKPQAALPVTKVRSKPYVAAPTVAPAPSPGVMPRQPAPYVEVAPPTGYETVALPGAAGGQIGCYTSAPVAERVRTRNGGTAVVCTRGDGTLTGWRPPLYPREAGVGAALTDPVGAAQQDAIPKPPKGYVLAWDDDRLNPNRGKGTAEGWAQQDQVWTRDVPAKLVADASAGKRKKNIVYVKAAPQLTLSSKGQPLAPPVQKKTSKAAKAGSYVQIGTFGVVSNAEGAAARLQGLGLPVARAKITSAGQPMQIVMAGPFGSASEAQNALSMARQAGFGDAFLR